MNGFDINISEYDFKSKSPQEQNWIIFKAVEGIDQRGCRFSRDRHKMDWRNTLIIVASTFAAVAASLFAFWKYLLCD